MKKLVSLLLVALSLLGLFDAYYLTLEHLGRVAIACVVGSVFDCGTVLDSPYSFFFGIPLAFLGLGHYLLLSTLALYNLLKRTKAVRYLFLVLSSWGFVFSLYLVVVQFFVIKAFCFYCLASAAISTTIFTLAFFALKKEVKGLIADSFSLLYHYLIKPLLFLLQPEFVHERTVLLGETLGKNKTVKRLSQALFAYKDKSLSQKLLGLNFVSPVGLAAGFDYEARLTGILPSLGFGFQSVGTITNGAYGGNPPPMLGRLPKSRSLMVNKGFKNQGAKKTAENLKSGKFEILVGVSIGRTNSKDLESVEKSIQDIAAAFKAFEKASVKNAYWELNISCPNLIHAPEVSFYPVKNLKKLLSAVDKLKLKEPLFIKMPIEVSNYQAKAMLTEIVKHEVSGVIFGNLQKNRKHPALIKAEVRKFKTGYFSGKPTFDRSNELISLAYKNFGDKLTIIGCGGVFSAEDAYEKISRGASLVQLITGLIFQGPQLVSQINLGLADILEKEGFKNIKEAVGSKHKSIKKIKV